MLLLLFLVLLSPISSPLCAQLSASLDVARTQAEFAGGNESSAISLAPSLYWQTRDVSVLAQTSWARFGDDTWSAQGSVGSSVYGQPILGLRPEFGVTAAGTLRQDGAGTGRLAGAARLHYARTSRGAWVGGGLRRAHDGTIARTVVVGDLGGWARLGAATIALTAVPTRIGDSLHHTDVIGALRVERGLLDATAFAGWRTWSRPSAAPDATWVGVDVAFWLSRHLALVAGAGTYPVDWAQGLPSGRFATLGLRMATRRPMERREVGTRLLPPGITPVVPAFEAVPDGSGRWSLRVHAPEATRVEVMGDFTLWEPVVLERGAEGRWLATFTLSPGVYRLNVRVNGEAWGVPPGVPVLQDEFSGAVGVLAIDQ